MTQLSRRKWGRSALTAAASTLAIAMATPSIAAQEPAANATQQDINIPPGQLDDALITVSEIFGVTVIAPSNLVRGLTSPAISGSISAEQAITALLQNTRLTVSQSPSGAFIVAEAAEERPAINPVLQETITPDTPPEPLVAETIVVQGRFQQSLIDRIPISLRELPFTLNVLDRSLIDERNFVIPSEAIAILPNADISVDQIGLGNPRFILRGYEARTLVNNRFQNAQAGNGGRDDSFIDRYEVLKGPASIALGPVDPGGIVNIVTKSPEDEFFAAFEVSTDQFGTFEAEYDVNFGATLGGDFLSARLSGAYRNIGFDADPQKREVLAIRPVIDLDLSQRTKGQLSVSYATVSVVPNQGFPLVSDGSIPPGFDTSTFTGFVDAETEDEDIFVETQLTHKFLDNLRLTLRGSYQDTTLTYDSIAGIYNYLYDDGGPGISLSNPVAYLYSGYVGQGIEENLFLDAQIAWDAEAFGNRQDFVFGVSYNDNLRDNELNLDGAIVPVNIFEIDQPRFEVVPSPEPDSFNDSTLELTSAFGEFAIRPTDWLSIIGGVRHDRQKRINRFILSQSESDETDTTFRLGASAELTKELNVYVSFAESFVPQGGVTISGANPGPTSGDSYEIGAKGTFWNERLAFNAALFRTDRTNIAVRDVVNSTPVLPIVSTVGEVRTQGVELSTDIQPTPGLNINLNAGFLDVEIIESDDLIGIPLSAPEMTFNAFATYEFQTGSLEGLVVGGGVRYVGERDSARVADFAFPDYTVGDLFVRYPVRESVDMSLNVINVTDELYLKTAGFGFGGLGGSNRFGDPRTLRLSLRARF